MSSQCQLEPKPIAPDQHNLQPANYSCSTSATYNRNHHSALKESSSLLLKDLGFLQAVNAPLSLSLTLPFIWNYHSIHLIIYFPLLLHQMFSKWCVWTMSVWYVCLNSAQKVVFLKDFNCSFNSSMFTFQQ